ncbi:hypothetical protein SAMN05880545_1322 [Microbacterium sp. RU33B]|nr:hypothetical protein SAMN05880545_1322 [Microbacterium sp. RU33B]
MILALCAAAGLALSACATPPSSAPLPDPPASDAAPGDSLGSLRPAPPEGEVMAQGTVMDVAGDVELCLGAIRESFPPQCDGIPLAGWSWNGVDGSETSGDVRWGAYALQGEYDGEAFTVTQPPIMLALYDPMPIPSEPQEPGVTDEDVLLAIQQELPDRLGGSILTSMAQEGRLVVDVVWDDGTWQKAADEDYGQDVVVIRSALRPVNP